MSFGLGPKSKIQVFAHFLPCFNCLFLNQLLGELPVAFFNFQKVHT